ncbi:MAG: tetratricopeptide repeat protein [Phycisphaerales bacterium]
MTTRSNALAIISIVAFPLALAAQTKPELQRPMQSLGGVRPGIPQNHLGPHNRYPQTIGQPSIRGNSRVISPTIFPPSIRRSTVQPTIAFPTNTTRPAFERPLVPQVFDPSGDPGSRIVTIPGSGLSIDGSYADDRFRLGFHIGSNAGLFVSPYARHTYPYFIGSGWCNSYDYSTPVIQGFYTSMAADPGLRQAVTPLAVPSVPLTRAERGDAALRAGDARLAISEYAAHLKEQPDDTMAMRSMGLALLDDARIDDAIAVISQAYRADPSLADQPVRKDAFVKGAKRLRDNLLRLSGHANKINTGASWHALAVLMQAEGRNENAGAMVKRAKKLGFDQAVVARMESALGT